MFSVSSQHVDTNRTATQRASGSFRHKASFSSVQFYKKQLLDNWNIFFPKLKRKRESHSCIWSVELCGDGETKSRESNCGRFSDVCCDNASPSETSVWNIRPESIIDWLLLIHWGQKKKLQPWIKECKSSSWVNSAVCYFWQTIKCNVNKSYSSSDLESYNYRIFIEFYWISRSQHPYFIITRSESHDDKTAFFIFIVTEIQKS